MTILIKDKTSIRYINAPDVNHLYLALEFNGCYHHSISAEGEISIYGAGHMVRISDTLPRLEWLSLV
jgi:hypothetical protein